MTAATPPVFGMIKSGSMAISIVAKAAICGIPSIRNMTVVAEMDCPKPALPTVIVAAVFFGQPKLFIHGC